VVVDVSSAPSFEDADTSTRNLLATEAAAGVRHHVALSVVGAERLSGSGYFRGTLGRISVGPPLNGIVEIAGPDRFRLDELIRERLSEIGAPARW
jgi:hypothetical protein